MARRKFVKSTSVKNGNNNGTYRRMETSKVDKTNFYRKPYYMTVGEEKGLSESNRGQV